jgi:ABC-type glutathione transport system ATPase component
MTESGTAVLLITDDLELAQNLADKFLILESGRKMLEGTMAQLLNQSRPHERTLRGVLEEITH